MINFKADKLFNPQRLIYRDGEGFFVEYYKSDASGKPLLDENDMPIVKVKRVKSIAIGLKNVTDVECYS